MLGLCIMCNPPPKFATAAMPLQEGALLGADCLLFLTLLGVTVGHHELHLWVAVQWESMSTQKTERHGPNQGQGQDGQGPGDSCLWGLP